MFHIVDSKSIKEGKTTDVYFERTMQILKAEGIDPQVKVEVRAKSFPRDWNWAVLAGIDELSELLSGLQVDAACLPEGEIFYAGEPVLQIGGRYSAFGALETAVLGFICQASGIATAAAHCKKAAGQRLLVHFGARRMHPAITHMIDRAAFIGGCDAVSAVSSAEFLGLPPTGTMPHALIMIIGDTVKAARLFNRIIDPGVKRVVLIDTLDDEKFAAVAVAEALGEDLFGIRLDTPSSRRGNFKELIKEVKWELALRGYADVKIFISGGLNVEQILDLNPVVDAYGIGTYISGAPVIDFSLDIVEIEGKPAAKRGKESGVKALASCPECGRRRIVSRAALSGAKCECGGEMIDLLKPLVRKGSVVADLPAAKEIHSRVVEALERL